MRRDQLILTFLLTLFFLASPILATNGYFSHGYGAKSKGMAGSGMALSLSTLSSSTNPAALVFLGKRIDLGVGFFMPDREFTVSGMPSMYPGTFPLNPGTVESGSKFFIMPHVGLNFMLNEMTSVGVAFYGNGGMNTNYDAAVFHGSSPTGVNLMQMFADITLSRKLNDNHAVGVTTILAYQLFKAEGLEAFKNFCSEGECLTNLGHDGSFGVGFRFGYLGQFSDMFSVGLSYQTKAKMQKFDKYAGLFAEQGGFDIPAAFNAGIAFNATKDLTLAVDVQKIMYGSVKSIANPFVPTQFFQGVLLGHDDGAGFGWKDVTVYKFGLQYALNNSLTLRTGFSTCDQPIEPSEVMFNILAPGVVEKHLTFGGTFKMANTKELTFYFMYAFSNNVTGANPMEAPGQQTIMLEMSQMEFGFEFSF